MTFSRLLHIIVGIIAFLFFTKLVDLVLPGFDAYVTGFILSLIHSVGRTLMVIVNHLIASFGPLAAVILAVYLIITGLGKPSGGQKGGDKKKRVKSDGQH